MFVAAAALGRRPLAVDGAELLAALRRTHPGHVSGSVGDGRFAAAESLLQTTRESADQKVPTIDPVTGRVLVSWVRLDNRAELARDLGWDRRRAVAATDPEYLLAAYDRWGTDCVARLEGDFAFALWDPQRRRLFAARDAIGIRPLYYARAPEAFVCATTTAPLTAVPGVDLSVRPEWLAQYAHRLSRDVTRTPFAGVERLPPGHWLRSDAHEVIVRCYHEFRDDSPWEDRRRDRWLEAYRERLFEAVRCRLRTPHLIGIENSGGLDSGSVVSLAAHLEPEARDRIHTFGYAVHPLEPEFIEAVNEGAGVGNADVLTAYDPETTWASLGWRALGYPVEHPNATGHMALYRLAAERGVRTLHSGHGGDETVTHPAWLAIHERLQRRNYLPLLQDLPGAPGLRPARLAREWWRSRGPRRSALLETFLARLSWSPFTPESLDAGDLRGRVLEVAHEEARHSTVNGFVRSLTVAPNLSIRTADCSVVAASVGLEYLWPLLDRRLVQQYLSTPTVWKYGDGHGRYLHRRAVTGVVPDKVAWKASKSMLRPGARPAGPAMPLRGRDQSASDLHPAVAVLVDPQVWRRGPDPAGGWFAASMFQRVWVLSDWLHDRG